MASYLAVFLALAVVVAPAVADTCTMCKTTFDSVYSSSSTTNAQKCDAIKKYGGCLSSASGDGCTTVITRAGEATAGVIALATAGYTCTITTTCTCELAYLGATMTTSDNKCVAAANFVRCAYGTTTAGCDSTKTSAVMRHVARTKVTAYCGCAAGNAVRVSFISFVFVAVGMLMKN
ncbi:uncharacterized protein LOC124112161 [Haliotis rufescens]|uniref:uncharacterized protein LOC124112161 n=1 Tax=Haliotis rufescens TaxID=6454 RepID=UPI001EAFADC1|nr:uncharacterized protein LOC124112161 [Haliotis rufescens]